MKLSQTGVGTVATPGRIRPGIGKVAIQVDGDGTTTWALEARVTPDAPWVPVIAAGTADKTPTLIDWMPEFRLNVSAGTGAVTAYLSATE